MTDSDFASPRRGFFIAIEGLDGSGKTTLAKNLCFLLEARGLKPLYVKEPTEGQWGQKIRRIAREGREGLSAEEEMGYFVKDRAEDVAANIAPALAAGRPVIADRYVASNIAYQSALGLAPETIIEANRDFPWPDLTLYLKCPVGEGLRRIEAGRPGGANPGFENPDFLGRVQKAFESLELEGFAVLEALDGPETLLRKSARLLEERGFLEKLSIIDTHLHLSLENFQNDAPAVLERAAAFGVEYFMDIGLDAQSSREVIATAHKYPPVFAAVGWHPHDADNFSDDQMPLLEQLCGDEKVLAVGEIGLDYYRNNSPGEKQRHVFEEMLKLAAKVKLPVAVHTRDAFEDTLSLLQKYAPHLKGGIIHCFTGSWEEAEAFLALGFYISLPGVITFSKGEELRKTAALCPEDRLLVETDAPFLAPVPFRGKRNEPSFLVYHLREVAKARGLSLAEAARMTSRNAKRLLAFPEENQR